MAISLTPAAAERVKSFIASRGKGLGLRLVKQLSTHWGAAADDGGKWVWARIALPSTEGGDAAVRR